MRVMMVLGQAGYPGHGIGEWVICQTGCPCGCPGQKAGSAIPNVWEWTVLCQDRHITYAPPRGINHPPAGPGTTGTCLSHPLSQ